MSCQQIIIELGLAKHSYQRKRSKLPTSIDVLNQLLLDKTISDEDVRNAYNKLSSNNNHDILSIKNEQHQSELNGEKLLSPSATLTRCDTGNDSQISEKDTTSHCDNNNDSKILEKDTTTLTSSSESTTSLIRRRHIALHVYYDGETYNGLAENIGSNNDTSVEREIFSALIKSNLLSSSNREHAHYSRCGRTDKGVSSCGQIIAMHLKSAIPIDASVAEDGIQIVDTNDLPKNSFDKCKVWLTPRQNKNKNKINDNNNANNTKRIQKEMNEYSYDKMLNNLLPNNIRILGWCVVSDDFSARFSTTSRIYRYFFIKKEQININQMKLGLQLLIGIHDYRNFCKMDIEKVYNYKRQIIRAELVELHDQNICYFEIEGQAFLWHQIRCIVHILFLIGYGLEEPTIITELLNIEKYSGKPNYPLANELPLVLHQCSYLNLNINYSVQNLWTTQCMLEQQYEYHLICIGRIQNCIKHLQYNSKVLSKDLIEFTKQLYDRKQKKNKNKNNNNSNTEYDDINSLNNTLFPQHQFITWNDALLYLNKFGFYTNSDHQLVDVAYTPLLLRSRGTTYEEKIDALLNNTNNSKRKVKYELNVIQKRKTKEEDTSFYNHMSKQGTTSSTTTTNSATNSTTNS